MKIIYIFLITLLTGCAAFDLAYIDEINVESMERKIADSPELTFQTRKIFSQITAAKNIQIFYKVFDPLNTPTLVEDWKKLYVLGEPSIPEWKYKKIASIKVYLPISDDTSAINEMKSKSSEIGGDAIIDVYKEPVTLANARSRDGDNIIIRKIIGYKYRGQIIKKIEN